MWCHLHGKNLFWLYLRGLQETIKVTDLIFDIGTPYGLENKIIQYGHQVASPPHVVPYLRDYEAFLQYCCNVGHLHRNIMQVQGLWPTGHLACLTVFITI